jgi:hypothetical protein
MGTHSFDFVSNFQPATRCARPLREAPIPESERRRRLSGAHLSSVLIFPGFGFVWTSMPIHLLADPISRLPRREITRAGVRCGVFKSVANPLAADTALHPL